MTVRPSCARHLGVTVLATQSLLGLSAAAETPADPAWVELTQPRNLVEAGVLGQSAYSAKADEYSGLNRKGPMAVGRVDLRGGESFDSPGAWRWRLSGSDLGLESRSVEAEFGVQGQYRLRLGHDQLLRNQSDSYQTPYTGVGGNALQLPANWLAVVVPRLSATTPNARGLASAVTASNALVAGVSTAPTTAQATAARSLQSTDLPAFQQVDLFTRRTRYGLGWEQLLDSRWTLRAAIENEHKEGRKPLGAHSHATGGDVSSILPIPIEQDDRKATLSLGYAGEDLHWQARYDVSSFRNNVPSVSWNLWSGPTITETLSTAPSNLFQKLLFSGTYQVSPATRIVGSLSYARNAQDEGLLHDNTARLVPQDTARALVVTEGASLKILQRATPALNLGASLKYDLRENRTPVATYAFTDNNEASGGNSPFQYLFPALPNLGTGINLAANTPYSRRVEEVGAEADYRFNPAHRVRAQWNSARSARYCIGSWADCVNASHDTEHSLQTDWFGQFDNQVSAQLGLLASRRRADYNENAFLARVPMANQTPTGATPAGSTAYGTLLALGLTGYGPAQGLSPAALPNSAQAFYFPLNNALGNTLYGYRNRISELLGMRRYDQADRDRSKLHVTLTWQTTDKLELQGGLSHSLDDYRHSTYGLQKSSNDGVHLDASFAATEDSNLALFASMVQMRTRIASNSYTANSTVATVGGATAVADGCFATVALRNANNKIDPCLDWRSDMSDRTATLGASVSMNKLLGGKLDLSGSLSYSEGRINNDVTGGNYVNNPYAGVSGAATGSIAAYYVPATALPLVRIKSLDLLLSGQYRVAKDHALRLSYGYQRLRSSDWAYEGSQDGALVQVLPTREQAPNYEVHTLGLNYVVSFR